MLAQAGSLFFSVDDLHPFDRLEQIADRSEHGGRKHSTRNSLTFNQKVTSV